MDTKVSEIIQVVKSYIVKDSRNIRKAILISAMICAGLGFIYGAVFGIATYLLVIETTGAD